VTITLRYASVGGICGLLIGIAGPALFLRSNLGPLTGFLLSGPMGAIAGTFCGLLAAERRGESRPGILGGVVLAWSLVAGYTLVMFRLSPRLAAAAIILQLIGAIATVLLVWRWTALVPRRAHRLAAILGVACFLTLAVASTAFPPVALPVRDKVAEGSFSFAFLLDPRLNASHHPPALLVDMARLCVQWAAIAFFGAASAAAFWLGQRR
jgi:hypothetical protein